MRKAILLAACAAAVTLAVGSANAADYPSKPIKIVHGSAAGAPQDVMLRRLAENMKEVAGVPVVVEPRPGGTGQVAIAYLQNQAADGYTIFSDATGITSVLQLPGAAYKWTDLTPLYRIQLDPFALYIKRDGKFKDLNGLLAAMKARPDKVRIGGYGTGSPHQITTLFLGEQAGVKVNWVPYTSGSNAIKAVMGGELDAAMSNISVYSRFKEKTQVVGVTSADRLAAFTDTPTFKEQKYDLVRYHWRGMFVKNGTPKEVLEKLFDIAAKGANRDDFKEYLAKSSTLSGKMTRAEFMNMLKAQAENDLKTLKAIGMIKG
ncbi:MAG: tripartite tricarboxylate transporter substrate binding protein [Rhodospirillaceae bacterium]|jgi:putative tricarboxylic transport membrane protein